MIFKKIIIKFIQLYQWFSRRFWKSNCRFYPTCSAYMMLSIKRFGIIYGLKIGLKRLLRCQPLFYKSCCDYLDPVPEKKKTD
jgi:putative membrane protein insertion efficiency factor